jgi:hypothetical protein
MDEIHDSQVLEAELYEFESLYKFIQIMYTVFRTFIMQQNTPSFTGIFTVLKWYSKCYCGASVKKH